MTRADDGSSGRSRMMRKSHVRFPEKGVATSGADQAPRSIPLWGHPLLYHYYRSMGFETKKDQGSISGALTARLSIKEAESKRKLTRKLEELPFIRFAGAAQHIAGSQRAHTTCLTLRSEGP
ncbi:hypothetical protein Bca101_071167 [Brassica carinata]